MKQSRPAPITDSDMKAACPSVPLQFNLRELSGSLGDMGTFLPLSVAMAMTCGMDIGLIFIFAGLMNIVTGLLFRQPIPVQPMKAIAAVAIAEGLSPGTIASAGMLMGVIMFLLAIFGGIDWIAKKIPLPVVRGIQAGVGVKLALKGLAWIGALPATGWDSWLVALLIGLIVVLCIRRCQPVLLYVFIGGFFLMGLYRGELFEGLTLSLPNFVIVLPEFSDWQTGLLRGAIPQLPLTLLNSVIAVCALSENYFPKRGVDPRRMAMSVGLMNLLCVPFGGMPMCHGAGGLAAQYRFGARTGGSVVMLGIMKIVAGFLLGGMLLTTLTYYPVSILAIMIFVAGVTLAKAAADVMHGRSAVIVILMVVATVWVNTLTGFVIGCLLAAVFYQFSKRKKPTA
ncbi:MAG: putative sulfate/molybdate transporter [Phycisphaeraceae bacterium]|nr:putative sulfate/molybdate transporter [Phycisphaeraceae bacterium]